MASPRRSPVLACNLPDSNRYGTVGRLLPGIEARLDPVPGLSEGKRLFVRGPNVMAGYLLPDNPGVVVAPEGGWHDTGDIVTMDDGFISIRGRAKRFAKLGGEMVSLVAVETLACGLWTDAQHVVLSFPDPRKGEQLLLVTDKAAASKDDLLAYARSEGFPDLWVPKAILVVAAVPVLASGKLTCRRPSRWRARPARPCKFSAASQCAKSPRAQVGVACHNAKMRSRVTPSTGLDRRAALLHG